MITWQFAIKVIVTAVVVVAVAEIAKRSSFWGATLASLPLFLLLPLMLRSGWSFWPSLTFACAVTVGAYFGLVWLLERTGVRL